VELAEKPNLAHPTGVRNRNALRNFELIGEFSSGQSGHLPIQGGARIAIRHQAAGLGKRTKIGGGGGTSQIPWAA
jgi:hypothetical protein